MPLFSAMVMGAMLSASPAPTLRPFTVLSLVRLGVYADEAVPARLSESLARQLDDRLSRLGPEWSVIPRYVADRLQGEQSVGAVTQAVALARTMGAEVALMSTIRELSVSMTAGSDEVDTRGEEGGPPDPERQYVVELVAIDAGNPQVRSHQSLLGTLFKLEGGFQELIHDLGEALDRLAAGRHKRQVETIFDLAPGEDQPMQDITYRISLGVFGGYNAVVRGYDRYESGLSGGLECRLQPYAEEVRQLIGFSVAFEEWPMLVPPGTNGTSEDLLSFNVGLLFNVWPDPTVNPFLGCALGYVVDWTRVHNTFTGPLSSATTSLGLVTSAGVEVPWGRFTWVPEIRAHWLFSPGRSGLYSALHLTYQLGFQVNF